MTREIEVTIFGVNAPAGGCGCGSGSNSACCGPAKSLKDEAADLEKMLQEKSGPGLRTKFVDVFSQEMSGFPEIGALLQEGKVRLPLVAINGQPRFHGGISRRMIAGAVEQLLKDVG